MRAVSILKILALLVPLAANLSAQIVSYTATGTIRLIANGFTDTISVGDTYNYTFSYNASTTPHASFGTYKQLRLISASVSVSNAAGTVVWSSPGDFDTGSNFNRTLTIQNQSPYDRLVFASEILDQTGLHGAGLYAGKTFSPVGASIQLEGPTTNLTSTAVPTFLNLAAWNPYSDLDPASALVLSFMASGGGNVVIRGSVDSLTAVPEPSATAALLGGASLAALVAWRRRRPHAEPATT